MMSVHCFFRGDFMNQAAARSLVTALCAEVDLLPDYWNIFEPINIPFRQDGLDEVVAALAPDSNETVRTLVCFVRKAKPRYLLTVDLQRWPTSLIAHNELKLAFEGPWPEAQLARYVTQIVQPRFPDYACVADATSQDLERFKELERTSYTKEEVRELFQGKQTAGKLWAPPFQRERERDGTVRYWFDACPMPGPHGCLMDVVWFNYFGRVYVDLIGKKRLASAGWARIEEIGDGLGCYATEKMHEPGSRERRNRICAALDDFFWTPGCKLKDKQAPIFDFSEQLATLDPETRTRLSEAKGRHIVFAGFTEQEEKQAIRQFAGEDSVYDPQTKLLSPKSKDHPDTE